jgi:hypothetical protein
MESHARQEEQRARKDAKNRPKNKTARRSGPSSKTRGEI